MMKISLDVDVDERVVSDLGGPEALQAEMTEMMKMLFQPKRKFTDADFADPNNKPSFKDFLLSMPDGNLDYEMGVKDSEE